MNNFSSSEIKSLIKLYHKGEYFVAASTLNDLLGVDESADEMVDREKYYQLYGYEQYTFEATPYEYLRDFLVKVKPSKDDVVYDLGCGFGQSILYGAINYPATFKGIEIISERIQAANEISKKLHLKNASFEAKNIVDCDFSDGTIFFLFNPFCKKTLEKVGAKLKDIAKYKQIRIVTWGGPSNDYFQGQGWLQEIPEYNFERLQYFQSKITN
jgi:SAM-dependent methyltransferase